MNNIENEAKFGDLIILEVLCSVFVPFPDGRGGTNFEGTDRVCGYYRRADENFIELSPFQKSCPVAPGSDVRFMAEVYADLQPELRHAKYARSTVLGYEIVRRFVLDGEDAIDCEIFGAEPNVDE